MTRVTDVQLKALAQTLDKAKAYQTKCNDEVLHALDEKDKSNVSLTRAETRLDIAKRETKRIKKVLDRAVKDHGRAMSVLTSNLAVYNAACDKAKKASNDVTAASNDYNVGYLFYIAANANEKKQQTNPVFDDGIELIPF